MKPKTNLMIICLLALLMTNASIKTTAQIVYTDITDTTIYIPNVVIIDSGSLYNLDIDNNTIWDFKVWAGTHYDYNGGHPIIWRSTGIDQYFFDDYNRISGGCYNNTMSFLNEGDTIDKSNIWYYFGKIYYTETYSSDQCTSVPNNDFFFGLKLVVNSDTLYGWVRCSATDTSVTIKDYAYNTVPNAAILAGQTIVGVGTDSLNALINIFAANKTLTVDFNGYQPAQGNIMIVNIPGQVIKSSPINGAHNLIPLNATSSGIYIVRVETPDIVVNKKIFFQEN